jgi:hypothetical protein
MTNSSNGEGIYKEILETLLRDTFTPIEWEHFEPYNVPAHAQIPIDPKHLDRLAGRYIAGSRLVLIVVPKNGYLEVEGVGNGHDLFPESELQCFSKTLHIIANFELDGKDKAPRLILHYTDRDVTLNRAD